MMLKFCPKTGRKRYAPFRKRVCNPDDNQNTVLTCIVVLKHNKLAFDKVLLCSKLKKLVNFLEVSSAKKAVAVCV